MTATRIARAGRVRFFIGLGVLVITMGFVAMFHSSQQQLDESRKMEIRCEQQQEAMTVQIAELENKLKVERQQHHQIKLNLEREAREQTELKEKSVQEINQKLSSLQQHYKLLKSQHDDFTEESAKEKAKQLADLTALQGRVQSIQSEHEQVVKAKDHEIDEWKTKYNQMQKDKQLLETSVTKSLETKLIQQLQQEIEEYKLHCTWRPVDKIYGPTINANVNNPIKSSTKSNIEKNFNAQIAVSDNLYEIPIKYTNNTVKTVGNGINKHDVGGGGGNDNGDEFTSLKSSQITDVKKRFKSDTIINSVENFQLVPKPLPDSLAESPLRSSPSTVSGGLHHKTSDANGIKMNVAPNAPLPIELRASSTTAASKKSDENRQAKHLKQIPNGVVPFQSNLDDISIKTLDRDPSSKIHENNRYANIVAEANEEKNGKGGGAGGAAADINESLRDAGNGDANSDTGAHEVNDSNDFVVDENHHGHVQDTFDHKDGIIDNAAEEDLNGYGNKLSKLNAVNHGNDIPNGSDDDLQVIHRPNDLDNRNKLKNEVNADQGKAYADEANLEEPGEDEDDDDYNGHIQRQDPAIRARR